MKTWFDVVLNKYHNKIKIKEFKSNDIIFNEDDYCQEICIVLKGQIIISTITYLEKEETKVWQYSSLMLAELFNEERSGRLVLPEV